MAQPIFERIPIIFEEIFAYENQANAGLILEILMTSNNKENINTCEIENQLKDLLGINKGSLGELIYETCQNYQREYWVSINLLPKIVNE